MRYNFTRKGSMYNIKIYYQCSNKRIYGAIYPKNTRLTL